MNLWDGAIKEATLTEVAPRDGLQNEATILKTSDKIHFIQLLEQAGVSRMEAISFVRRDKVPQMQDAAEVAAQLDDIVAETIALVPNQKGFERAVQCGCKSLAMVTATSNTFNRNNINRDIPESLQDISSIVQQVQKRSLKLRVHLSTTFGCPYEGDIPLKTVIPIVETLLSWNIQEIVLADTIGAATPPRVHSLLKMLPTIPSGTRITLHFHDTQGMGLTNILTALDRGFTSFDSSAGGIGGCPYAPGAGGNVATEEVLLLFDSLGIQTGIEREKIFTAVEFIASKLGTKTCYSKLFRSRRT